MLSVQSSQQALLLSKHRDIVKQNGFFRYWEEAVLFVVKYILKKESTGFLEGSRCFFVVK